MSMMHRLHYFIPFIFKVQKFRKIYIHFFNQTSLLLNSLKKLFCTICRQNRTGHKISNNHLKFFVHLIQSVAFSNTWKNYIMQKILLYFITNLFLWNIFLAVEKTYLTCLSDSLFRVKKIHWLSIAYCQSKNLIHFFPLFL